MNFFGIYYFLFIFNGSLAVDIFLKYMYIFLVYFIFYNGSLVVDTFMLTFLCVYNFSFLFLLISFFFFTMVVWYSGCYS